MKKTYKFRLYPSKKQTILLNNTLKTCKYLYNSQLEYEKYIFTKEKRFANKLELNNLLPDLKIINPKLRDTHSQVLQNINDRVTNAFNNFFKRIKRGEKAGYPRFKSTYNSFTYPQSGFQIKNKLKISKIGDISIKLHREIKGKIKTLTILKTTTNKWFACFSVEQEIKLTKHRNNKVIGIDLGIEKFATLSDNQIIKNPRTLRKSLTLLQLRSRQLSKKKKGSNNRNKTRLKLARLHEKIYNQRMDFLHKTTNILVNTYDCIALEDLKSKTMKNKYLQLSINDASWNKFRQLLSYKAIEAGVRLEFVNPRNTSQRCSSCKRIVKKSLSTRIHKCECGLLMDRDLNASLNILQKSSFFNKIPLGQGELTPVELFQ